MMAPLLRLRSKRTLLRSGCSSALSDTMSQAGAPFAAKQAVQGQFFPEGVLWDGEKIQTPVTARFLKDLRAATGVESHLVRHGYLRKTVDRRL